MTAEGAAASNAAARSASLFGVPDAPVKSAAAKGDVPAAALLDRRSEKLEVPREGPAPEDLENPDETVFREVAGTEDLEALTDRLQAAEGVDEPAAVTLLWDGMPRHADLGGLAFAFTPLDVWVVQPTIELSSAKIFEAV